MSRAGLWWKWKTSWGLLMVWKGKFIWERQSQLASWEVGDERLVLLVWKPDLDAKSESSLWSCSWAAGVIFQWAAWNLMMSSSSS